MTEEDIDNILGKAHRIGDDTRFAELLPTHFMLEQNYPNPFNPETVLPFTLNQAAGVELANLQCTRPAGAFIVSRYLSCRVSSIALGCTLMTMEMRSLLVCIFCSLLSKIRWL